MLIRSNKENRKWLNTKPFRTMALSYYNKGYYDLAPSKEKNYLNWRNFWEEERQKILYGYEVNGCKITGLHYYYLNYCPIQATYQDTDKKSSKRKTKINKRTLFPSFWDGDYDFFWSFEIAKNGLFNEDSIAPSTEKEREKWNSLNNEYKDIIDSIEFNNIDNKFSNEKLTTLREEANKLKEERDTISDIVLDRIGLKVDIHLDYLDGGYHLICAKSRRKGFSYKAAAVLSAYINLFREIQVSVGSFLSDYSESSMSMIKSYMDFLLINTPLGKRRIKDTKDYIKTGYVEIERGVRVEKGTKVELFMVTFQDNPDKLRGKNLKLLVLEEAGKFPNLVSTYNKTIPTVSQGNMTYGTILAFGTGGSMDGDSNDFANMFYNPMAYKFLPFKNIWDENTEENYCGFFHPTQLNQEGHIDENGNSNIETALKEEYLVRAKLLKNSVSDKDLVERKAEYPLSPSEAFLIPSANIFPVEKLSARLSKVRMDKSYCNFSFSMPVTLVLKGDEVIAQPEFNKKPLYFSKIDKNQNKDGCVVIYEHPEKTLDKNGYKIGYDPYQQEGRGTSLAAIYVYKRIIQGSALRNIIVAQYVGRPDSINKVHEIAYLLAKYYNSKVLFENNAGDVGSWFRERRLEKYLEVQPTEVIKMSVKNSSYRRAYGMPMSDSIKRDGEKYIKEWLETYIGEDVEGNIITPINYIYDIGLLEELIRYNRKINTDRVMALMMCMFQDKKHTLEYITESESNSFIPSTWFGKGIF